MKIVLKDLAQCFPQLSLDMVVVIRYTLEIYYGSKHYSEVNIDTGVIQLLSLVTPVK